MTDPADLAAPDRIEREVVIDAAVETVWNLVSVPGWWINGGTIIEHPIRYGTVPGVAMVSDPEHGEFAVLVVELDRPRYAAFRWSSGGSHATLDSSTLVEFWLVGSAPTTLRVVESGFSALPASDSDRRKNVDDNTEGWGIELEAARRHVSVDAP